MSDNISLDERQMNDIWDVTTHPNREIYERWKAFNEARGIRTRGRFAEIGRVNTELFEEAMIKEMEAGNVTGN